MPASQIDGIPRAFATAVSQLNPRQESYVPELTALILTQARRYRASDVHLNPCETELQMQWRIDGVLCSVMGFDRELASRITARLKVISGLLTYRTDVPQEGRVAREHSSSEVRVTTFPSLYGEKVAIRLFAEQDQLQMLDQLGLPGMVEVGLRTHLEATSGVILLTGPSGSGKTTTAYACLRDVRDRSSGTRCLMTLEDPIESAIAGVIQSQVKPAAGFSLTTGLRSLMRQDPDVILVGEIRDPETAEAAFQAALTGHLVVTTFHAGSAVEALTRLMEMQLEPYLIRSALRAVFCQRLLRRSCVSCSSKSSESTKSRNPADKNSAHATLNALCPACSGTGYAGRLVLAELLEPEHPELVQGLLSRADARRMSALAEATGMVTLAQVAANAVAEGQTTQEEVLRVLGGRRS